MLLIFHDTLYFSKQTQVEAQHHHWLQQSLCYICKKNSVESFLS